MRTILGKYMHLIRALFAVGLAVLVSMFIVFNIKIILSAMIGLTLFMLLMLAMPIIGCFVSLLGLQACKASAYCRAR